MHGTRPEIRLLSVEQFHERHQVRLVLRGQDEESSRHEIEESGVVRYKEYSSAEWTSGVDRRGGVGPGREIYALNASRCACCCAFSTISVAKKQCACVIAVSVRFSTSFTSCSP